MRMNARLPLTALALAAFAALAGAQDLDLAGRTKFASFDLSLAPTLTGSLDGRADLSLNWLDWLQTEIGVSALNNQLSTSDSSGDSTRLTTTLSASVEAIRINQNIIWKILPFKLRWLELHAGILGRLVNIDEKRFGMDASGSAFYDIQTTTSYLKPLASVGGGLNLGMAKLEGTYEVSPVAVNESYSGKAIENGGSGIVATTFTGDDIGLETRISGKARLDLRAFGLYGSGEYFRHLGYNSYVASGVAKPYAYTTVDYLLGGGVKLNFIKLSGVSPYLGATWIQHRFEPNASLSGGQKTANSDHWRLDFGFGI